VCQAVCEIETSSLVTLWSRPFKVSDGVYDVAAFVENSNIFGLERLQYVFRLEDEEGLLIKERVGETYVNPDERFVIVESDVMTGSREAARVLIEFKNRSEWIRFESLSDRPIISTRDKEFEVVRSPKVTARIENKSLRDLEDVEVPVVVFDVDENVIGVSKTEIELLDKDLPFTVFYTWPEKFLGEAIFVELFPRMNIVSEEVQKQQ